jgi:hypothetical protein
MSLKDLYKTYEQWRAEYYYGETNGTQIKFVPELMKKIRDLGYLTSVNETEDICELFRNEHVKEYSETITVSSIIEKSESRKITRPIMRFDMTYDPISETTFGVSDSKTVYPGEGRLFVKLRPLSYDVIVYGGGDGDDRVIYAPLDETGKQVLWTFDWETFLVKEPKYEIFFDDVNTDGAFLLKKVKE